ncbi:MAG: acyl-CoA dehydrogenase family protein [Deltaproteobacteria bacterium]|nr:acyl-CoA dehydrogenase family protein [Deltaproteobacteria bacterium]
MQQLSETHQAFRATCRRFVEREIKPFATQWEEAEAFPRELFARAGAAGLLGAAFPEAYGGAGGDLLHALVMTEELIAGGSSGVAAGLGSLSIALPPILRLGSERQKQMFVPAVLSGDKVAALAITEPGAGSDVAGTALRARRDGDGDAYVLDGRKMFITSGCKADLIVSLARTSDDPHQGLTFFVVEKTMAGFSASASLKKTGWRASDTAELLYDGVRVPASHRLGEEGSGFLSLMQTFVGERLMLSAMGHASAELALAEAINYVKQRQAFGKPLAGFQVTRHKLAQMASETRIAKVFNYHVAERAIAGQDVAMDAAIAKNFSADVAQRVCHQAVQLFGGMGYMRETLVERLSRDVRLLSIGGGTTEIMNEIISRLLPLR